VLVSSEASHTMAYKVQLGAAHLEGLISGSSTVSTVGSLSSSGDIAVTGAVHATTLFGDGAGLTNISADGIDVTSSTGDLAYSLVFTEGFQTDGTLGLGGNADLNYNADSAILSGNAGLQMVEGSIFGGALNVSGAVTFANTASLSNVDITGAVSASSTLQIVGAALLGGTLGVSGAVSAESTVTIEGTGSFSSVDMTGSLSGSNTAVFGSSISSSGDIAISGAYHGDGSNLTGIAGNVSGSARHYSSTGLETSGYLKVSGSTTLAGTVAAGDTVTVDKDHSATVATTVTGLEIDFDKTGASTSNNTMYGLKVDMDNTTATNGANSMYGLHVTPTLTHAADAGNTLVYGALINAQGGTNGTSFVQGARIEAGGGDINYGIQLDVEDGGVDLRIESSADSGDYFQIQTTTHGATTITTVDDDASAADLTFNVDGDITLDPVGGNVTVDAAISSSGGAQVVGNTLLGGQLGISGGVQFHVTTVITDTHLTASTATTYQVVSGGTTALTVMLPSASTGENYQYAVKRHALMSGNVTITGSDIADVIDGNAKLTLETAGASVFLISDGTQWNIF